MCIYRERKRQGPISNRRLVQLWELVKQCLRRWSSCLMLELQTHRVGGWDAKLDVKRERSRAGWTVQPGAGTSWRWTREPMSVPFASDLGGVATLQKPELNTHGSKHTDRPRRRMLKGRPGRGGAVEARLLCQVPKMSLQTRSTCVSYR